MGEITFIGETSIEFLCNPRHLLLVHWLNSLFRLGQYSSSNMIVKNSWGHFLKYYWRVLTVQCDNEEIFNK
jgi:hypothetical protein